jgi:hypothetical protein
VTQEPPPGAVEPPPAQSPERRAFHIFINYRREDTAGHAGRLYDALAARFGDDHVFMDIDAIDPGEDFTQVVEQSVGSCDVLLALIGRRWTTSTDDAGRRRLDKPNDWVRTEIKAALDRRDTKVIPTLVQGAEMPSSDELPHSLEALAHRNAAELSDSRWHSDVQRLIRHLEELAGSRAPRMRPTKRAARRPLPRWLIPVGAVVALLAAVLAAVLLFSRGGSEGNGELDQYVARTDAVLEKSAETRSDLGALGNKISAQGAGRSGGIGQDEAISEISQIIGRRRGLLDALPVDAPAPFERAHELLRESLAASLAANEARKRWIGAFYAGSDREPELRADVAQLDSTASSTKDDFLAEYNTVRRQELDLPATHIRF